MFEILSMNGLGIFTFSFLMVILALLIFCFGILDSINVHWHRLWNGMEWLFVDQFGSTIITAELRPKRRTTTATRVSGFPSKRTATRERGKWVLPGWGLLHEKRDVSTRCL